MAHRQPIFVVAEAVHDRGVLGEDDSGRRGLKCGIVLLGQVYMGSEKFA